MAVIATIELDDFVSLRESARETNGGHARFRAGVAHADFLNAGHRGTDQFRHRHLEGIRDSETGAVFRRLLDRLEDFRMGMAKNRRAPGADIVEVFIAIHIPDARAPGLLDKERLPAHRAKRAHGRVDATRDVLQGLGK